jgi:RNA:NAD 2'-phosphotransferase (TPT1/KptA family)
VLTEEGYAELMESSLDMAKDLLHRIDIRYARHGRWWCGGVMERDRVVVSREHARISGYDPISQEDMPHGRRLGDLSYRVSRILRHDASRHGISISPAGWMAASDLLWAVRRTADQYDRPAPEATYDNLWYVFKNDASRYQVSVTDTKRGFGMRMVRAVTGHSCREVKTAALYADRQRFELCQDAPQYVFHGTYLHSVPGILEQGLIPGGLVARGSNTERELFFSPLPPGHVGNPPGSQKAPGGRPHGVGIIIDFHQALMDGIPFHYTAGGAIVTRRSLPGGYIALIYDLKTGQVLFRRGFDTRLKGWLKPTDTGVASGRPYEGDSGRGWTGDASASSGGCYYAEPEVQDPRYLFHARRLRSTVCLACGKWAKVGCITCPHCRAGIINPWHRDGHASHFVRSVSVEHYHMDDINGQEKLSMIENHDISCTITSMVHSSLYMVPMASEAAAFNKSLAARRNRFSMAAKIFRDAEREAKKKGVFRNVFEYIDSVEAVRLKYASMLTDPENYTGGIALCLSPAHHYAKFQEKHTLEDLWQMRGGHDDDLGELQIQGKNKGSSKGKGKPEKGSGKGSKGKGKEAANRGRKGK